MPLTWPQNTLQGKAGDVVVVMDNWKASHHATLLKPTTVPSKLYRVTTK